MYTSPKDEALSTRDVSDQTGLTYRQLDYWVRLGIVDSDLWLTDTEPTPGSGHQRRWNPAIIEPLRTVHRIVNSDLLGNKGGGGGPNCRLVKLILEHHDDGHIELSPGAHITWTTTTALQRADNHAMAAT